MLIKVMKLFQRKVMPKERTPVKSQVAILFVMDMGNYCED
jgi:hypothetical protein